MVNLLHAANDVARWGPLRVRWKRSSACCLKYFRAADSYYCLADNGHRLADCFADDVLPLVYRAFYCVGSSVLKLARRELSASY